MHSESIQVTRISPSQLLGKGTVERLADMCENEQPDVVIINHTLSPVQQRNLEKSLKTKVIDRTALILEIFGDRATTKEGRIQVELAALEYQKSRLVRSWTHLERQRGGAGFMGGPGETQIEIDRRLIADRITSLKKQLESVKKTRKLGREARERVPFPIIALVGYTNAGKSTLFNTLTNAKVMAEDLLFATLDPTMRKLDLPNGQKVILADTVGFISDLPTSLIAAFRSTLEQLEYANVILHVRDIARPDSQAQCDDVHVVMKELGIEPESDPRITEVWNKIDLLEGSTLENLQNKADRNDDIICVSALQKNSLNALTKRIAEKISHSSLHYDFCIPHSKGEAIAWLYENGEVADRKDEVDGALLHVILSPEIASRFQTHYGFKPLEDASNQDKESTTHEHSSH